MVSIAGKDMLTVNICRGVHMRKGIYCMRPYQQMSRGGEQDKPLLFPLQMAYQVVDVDQSPEYLMLKSDQLKAPLKDFYW